MSTGLGIFFGLVFCGIAYIYAKNKDGINSKTALKFIGYIVGGFVLLTVALIAGAIAIDYYSNQPKQESQFKDVKLGESYSDFMFKTGGNPTASNSTKGSKPNDGSYAPSKFNGVVDIYEGKVVRVGYYCNANQYDSTALNRISCGDSSQAIENKFGNKIVAMCQIGEDKPKETFLYRARMYIAKQYNVAYLLDNNKVTALVLYDGNSEMAPIGYTTCNK